MSRQPAPPALHPSPDLLLDYATGVAEPDRPSGAGGPSGRLRSLSRRGRGAARTSRRLPALVALDALDALGALDALECCRSGLEPVVGEAQGDDRLRTAGAGPRGRADESRPASAGGGVGRTGVAKAAFLAAAALLSPGIRWAPVINDLSTGSMLVAVQGRTKSAFPAHRHVGPELGVILEGGYEDQTGDYRLGDFFAYEPGTSHRPWTDLRKDAPR